MTIYVIHGGTFVAAGDASPAFDISNLSGDFTLRTTIESLTAGKRVLLAVQESADGFASDVRTLTVINATGGTGAPAPESYSIRAYQIPSTRLGVANVHLRLFAQAIDSAAVAILSLVWEQ